MKFLIVEPDAGMHNFYSNLFLSLFSSISLEFKQSAEAALEVLENSIVDMVFSETFLPDADIFSFLYEVNQKNIPLIIISSERSERMMVETLRSGAMDFLTKSSIKKGILEHVVKRALLEADRWVEIQKYSKNLPHRLEFDRENEVLKAFIIRERFENQAKNISMDLMKHHEVKLTEGENVYVIYLYIQLEFQKDFLATHDQEYISRVVSSCMQICLTIPERFGGRVWTKKEDGCFFAFLNENYQQAILAAIEVYAAINIFNYTEEFMNGRVNIHMGIGSGLTIYRENKSQLYCEALNLAAHLAIKSRPGQNSLRISSDIYSNISSTTARYFEKQPDFEENVIYGFTMNIIPEV